MKRSNLKPNNMRSSAAHEQSERVSTLASRWLKGWICLACVLCSFGLLIACTPSTTAAGTTDAGINQGAATQEQEDGEALVRWTATVSGAERWSGSFQGESGSAIVQDGTLLELDLSNRVYAGGARYGLGGPALDSEPFMLTLQTQELTGPGGGAILKYGLADSGIPEDAYFAGPLTDLNLSVGEGVVSGTAVLEMRNSPGETVEVRIEFVDVGIKD